MKVRNILLIFMLVLPLQVMLSRDCLGAADGDRSGQNRPCLGCHGKQEIAVPFQDSGSVSGYVDEEKLKSSVHALFACTDCHAEFRGENHPKRNFRSRQQYRVRSSLACRRCHADEQLRTRPVHVDVLNGEKAGTPVVCTDCHEAHAVTGVMKKKTLSDEARLCLRCHRQRIQMAFQNGEKLSVAVAPEHLEASVHNKLSCSDCHYGFSSEAHPKRNFRTRRDMTIASAELCRRCHFDIYTKLQDSIHYTKLSQGDLNAPVCTDCHDSHAIAAAGKERIDSANRCRKCHLDIYSIYASSVHGGALLNEHNKDVPVCVDCHKTHDIQSPRTVEYRERIPEMCSRCHANKETMAKYGLSTDVMKTYLSDFHGVTLGFYIKQKNLLPQPAKSIAVCTDCHGTHNITSTVSPDATIVKANLVQRCRKCHANATENFPNAWLSHYKPSLQRAPLIFIIGILYRVFTPLMVIGLVLQILLHIWRYAVNR
ncbi:MAG TPA: cytochrome c3 family protein [Nitrospirota bacterium]